MDDFQHRIPPWVLTLLLHNWPIMLYSLLVLLSAVRAYMRPARPVLLFLYGSLVLALAFEYQKHGRESVQGTIDYVFARGPNFRDAASAALMDILPVAADLLGFALIALSMVTARRENRVSRPTTNSTPR